MKRIKILYGSSQMELQTSIDNWIKKENPEIINCSISTDDHSNKYIAIIYEDNTGNSPVKL